MKKLTDKELQIMEVLWEKGPLSTRDIIGHLPDTSAHFNTIATYVRRLEQHGMISHHFISRLVKRHEVSVDELKELIKMVEEE